MHDDETRRAASRWYSTSAPVATGHERTPVLALLGAWPSMPTGPRPPPSEIARSVGRELVLITGGHEDGPGKMSVAQCRVADNGHDDVEPGIGLELLGGKVTVCGVSGIKG